ncbi:hypothetical protein K2173_027135 [Erythroxylum novogranatense]|uniref:U-box domain-containing protein n=1 Tax=Erythroxylum novogranatense TaxID=1862640 RepID=A0AAV8TYI5_9ROSI|nr:hypothetical protein K2173_027135 [Erythroxylum novogranatense]
MVFGWRRKRPTFGNKGRKKQQAGANSHLEPLVPQHFLCPISLSLMKDPVTLSSGITYDRENIETWLEAGNFTCPVTNQVLGSFDQIPNHSLRKMIQEWCVENRNYGVERIPTPRVPVSPYQVSELLFSVASSTKSLDRLGCLELVKNINKWGKESERNRRSIVVNGTSTVLAEAFHAFAMDSFERNACLLDEILFAITWMFPLDVEAQAQLGTKVSLECMVWFLKCRAEDTSPKQNSILTLKELLSSNQQHIESLASIPGVVELLFGFIEKPICPTITKSSLLLVFYLLSSELSGERIKLEFVNLGLVSLMLKLIVDSEKSLSERALGVLDRLCECEEGRQQVYNNALTIPVLVKKILRVSELASQYSVSAILKLIKLDKKHEETVLVEAVQVGAFQKLVLLLQLGCGDDTKEKATELLKLINPYRAGLECIESVDFKNLKRSF